MESVSFNLCTVSSIVILPVLVYRVWYVISTNITTIVKLCIAELLISAFVSGHENIVNEITLSFLVNWPYYTR